MRLFTFCTLLLMSLLCWIAYECGIFDCRRPQPEAQPPSPILKSTVRAYAAAFQELDRWLNRDVPIKQTTPAALPSPQREPIPPDNPPIVWADQHWPIQWPTSADCFVYIPPAPHPSPPRLEIRNHPHGTKLR